MKKHDKSKWISYQNYVRELPLQTKLFLVLMPATLIDLSLQFFESKIILGTLIFLVIGSVVSLAKTDYKRYLMKERKNKEEEALFVKIEESLGSFQDSIDEYQNEPESQKEPDDKIPVPDCAIIVGPENSESYLIPYNFNHLENHEKNALQAASNILKKKGFSFQILKYQANHPFFDTAPKIKVPQDKKNNLHQFPLHFLNYN